MKKVIATMMMFVLLMAPISAVYADNASDIISIDAVISDIRAELNIKATDPINPDKVSDDLLEQLGDSVMEEMIGNHDLHEQMDARMGGDGSATLISMHIRMGYEYLYRVLNGSNLGFGPAENDNWSNMMGYSYWGMMNGLAGNSMMNYSGRGMMNGFAFNSLMGFHNGGGYRMGNQYWNSNVTPTTTPATSARANQATTNAAVTQNWGSQTPCWSNGGSTPDSMYQTPSNSNTINSGNWDSMNWKNNGMMN